MGCHLIAVVKHCLVPLLLVDIGVARVDRSQSPGNIMCEGYNNKGVGSTIFDHSHTRKRNPKTAWLTVFTVVLIALGYVAENLQGFLFSIY